MMHFKIFLLHPCHFFNLNFCQSQSHCSWCFFSSSLPHLLAVLSSFQLVASIILLLLIVLPFFGKFQLNEDFLIVLFANNWTWVQWKEGKMHYKTIQHVRNQCWVALENWNCHFLSIMKYVSNVLVTLYMIPHQQYTPPYYQKKISHTITQTMPRQRCGKC